MKSIPDNIELKYPFAYINVNSIGDHYIEITCVDDNFEVKYKFDGFHGFENRSEFFDRKPEDRYELVTLPKAGFCFPVSYIEYKDFKSTLSDYELLQINEKAKLWRFLSITNFIELYSSDDPVREIKKT